MKAAILALVTAGALLASTSTADAQYRHRGYYNGGWGGARHYSSFNYSPYRHYGGYYGYRPYNYGYYPYNRGLYFGNTYPYRYYGGYPYYGSRYYFGGNWYRYW